MSVKNSRFSRYNFFRSLVFAAIGSSVNFSIQATALAGEPKAFELIAQCEFDANAEVRLAVDNERITETSALFRSVAYILSVELKASADENGVSKKVITTITTADGSIYRLSGGASPTSEIEVYKNGVYYGPCTKGFLNQKVLAQLSQKYSVLAPKYEFAHCRIDNAGGRIVITAQAGPAAGSVLLKGVYSDEQADLVMLATSLKETDQTESYTLSLKGQGAFTHSAAGYHTQEMSALNVQISRRSSNPLDGSITSDAEGAEELAYNCVFSNVWWVKQQLAAAVR